MALFIAIMVAAPLALHAPTTILAAAGTEQPTGRGPTQSAAQRAVALGETTAADLGTIDVDIAILDRRDDRISANSSATTPTLSASLAKLILAVDIVDRHRDAGTILGEPDLGLIGRALGPSDDLAMNELWTRFDGPAAIARVVERLGLTGTAPPALPEFWGQTTITAIDVALVYRYVMGLSAAERDLILTPLAFAPALAADGFLQDYGLLSPDVGGAAAKQGWMCCPDGSLYLHSAGLIGESGRFAVVLLGRGSPDLGWEVARQELTTVAAAITNTLTADARQLS
ncbi:hypothetical protein GORHZ_070_00470 [Gordonia rhizosphera NBRC 16068]|uniref:Beta-lactamase n=2 Tax=Gordonia rhizosphera TaxID=83341 RepID=K6WC96_9ACTN|nr:hypothetical protein GORHZ_070_00470 [Gordonia rhizosphera NBRC 16068]